MKKNKTCTRVCPDRAVDRSSLLIFGCIDRSVCVRACVALLFLLLCSCALPPADVRACHGGGQRFLRSYTVVVFKYILRTQFLLSKYPNTRMFLYYCLVLWKLCQTVDHRYFQGNWGSRMSFLLLDCSGKRPMLLK